MKKVTGLWMVGMAAYSLSAQTNTLTLPEAKRLALERNWDLLAAKSGIDLASAQLIVAKEFPNPNVSASSAKIGNGEASTPAGNGIWARNYDTIFAVNQLIEIGGKRHDRQEAARAGLLGAKARFLDAKRLLDQGVTKAYANALLAGENALILHESAGYMRHEQEIAEARFKAGDLAEADLKQIQVAAERYVLQEASADTMALQARTVLEILLGVNQPKGAWRAADSLEQISRTVSAEVAPKPDALRPDVLAAETDVRAADANVRLQKAIRIPDPTFGLQYEHNPPGGGPPTDTAGFGVSFPIPLWNLNKGGISAAKAAAEQSRLTLAKLEAQMVADMVNAEAAYHEAADRLIRYREQIRPQSRAARESVIFRFDKGGASLVDLLEAERTDNDVRLATAQAMDDTVSTAADLASARTALTETELSASK